MISTTSDIAREVDTAMLLIGGSCLVMLIGITVAMVYFAIKYRRGRSKTTSQLGGHAGLEIAWTVIPTIIVIWMFFVGLDGFQMMRNVPEDAMVVEVTGKRWVWSFRYPEEDLDTTMMVVPVKTDLKLELIGPADDVLHSFFLPEFRVKEDVRPGQRSYLWFRAEETGEFNIFCAEFCGKDHSKMISRLRVVTEPEFRAWLKAEKARKLKPMYIDQLFTKAGKPHPEMDEKKLLATAEPLYATFCASCHGAKGDGSGLPGQARDFRTFEKWKRTNKEVDIFRTLTVGIEGAAMRAYPNLSAWERLALAKYVQGFNPNSPEDTREECEKLIEEYGLDKVRPPKDIIPVEDAITILAKEANGGK